MKQCSVQVKPILVFQHRKPYPLDVSRLTPLTPTSASARRRALRTLWRRTCQRHIHARVTWRNKLNRYLLP